VTERSPGIPTRRRLLAAAATAGAGARARRLRLPSRRRRPRVGVVDSDQRAPRTRNDAVRGHSGPPVRRPEPVRTHVRLRDRDVAAKRGERDRERGRRDGATRLAAETERQAVAPPAVTERSVFVPVEGDEPPRSTATRRGSTPTRGRRPPGPKATRPSRETRSAGRSMSS